MPSSTKRIAKNTAFLYVRMLVVVCTSLYTVRVVLNALGEIDFGIYGVTAASIALFAFIANAMAQATQRFLSIDIARLDTSALSKTFSASFVIYALIALLVLGLSEVAGLWLLNNRLEIPIERLNAAHTAFQLSVAASMFSIIQTPYNALIIAREEMWFFSLASIGDAALKLGIAYAVSNSSLDRLELYAALFLGANITVFLMYAGFTMYRFKEARIKLHRQWAIYRELASFSSWSLIGNAAAAGRTQGVNLLLNVFFGPTVNASFVVMSQAQGAITTFTQSLQTALTPQIYQSFGKGNLERMRRLVVIGSKISFVLLLIMATPVIYCLNLILDLWLGSPPAYTAVFIEWMMLMILIETMALPLIAGAAATGRIKWYQISLGGILLLTVPGSYMVFTIAPDPRAFLLVSAAVSGAAFGVRLWFLHHMIAFDWKHYVIATLAPAVALSAVAYGLILALRLFVPPESIRAAMIGVGAIVPTLLTACWFIGLTAGERHFLLETVRKKGAFAR